MPFRIVSRAKVLFCASAILAISSISAMACQVPVFRYALERWSPAPYRVTVVTAQPLTAEQESWLAPLKVGVSGPAGLKVERTVQGDTKQPELVVYFPTKSNGASQGIAAVLPFSESGVAQLMNSPARQEIASQLIKGNSVVWVLLESGDQEKDERCKRDLEKEIELAKGRLSLPTADELDIKPDLLSKVGIPWRIDFTIVSIRRNDETERLLVESLLSSEEDLREFEEPILFPIFGRGIVLYALVGDGIEQETIREAISFVMGPCSCQVKEQNPGFDLFLPVDWDQAVGSVLISQPPPASDLPPRLLKIPSGSKR